LQYEAEFQPLQIETQRLRLTGLTPLDMSLIFEKYIKEDIKKILGHHSDEEYEKEAFKQRSGYAAYNRGFIQFLIREKGDEQVIGRCGLHNWNPEHHRAEIGYHLSEESYKRKGLMTEAVAAVIGYGFNTLHLNRIEAMAAKDNIPSLRILAKFNFVNEGTLRAHYFTGKRYEDSIVFSILRDEYLKSK
jgi:[ribosomal protein S5]-alanine N-acetyltransferase